MLKHHLWRVTYQVSQYNQPNLSPMQNKDEYFAVFDPDIENLIIYIKSKFPGQIVELTNITYIGTVEVESPTN